MFTYKKFLEIRRDFIKKELCDGGLILIANREPKNTFWQKFWEIPKHGIMTFKGDLITWYPTRKDLPDFENKIEIETNEIEKVWRPKKSWFPLANINAMGMCIFCFNYKDGKCDKWSVDRGMFREELKQIKLLSQIENPSTAKRSRKVTSLRS
jgi:hypothetical protein